MSFLPPKLSFLFLPVWSQLLSLPAPFAPCSSHEINSQPKGLHDTLGSTEVGLASLHTLPPLPSPGSCSLAEGIQSLGVCSYSQEPNRPHCTFSATKLRSCFMLSSACKEPCQRPANRGHLSIDLPRPTSPHAGLQLEARRPSSDSGVVRSSFET